MGTKPSGERNMSCCSHDTAVKSGAAVALGASIVGAFGFVISAALPFVDCRYGGEGHIFDEHLNNADAVDGTRACLALSLLLNIAGAVLCSIPLCYKFSKVIAIVGAVVSLLGAIFLLMSGYIWVGKHDNDTCHGSGLLGPFIFGWITVIMTIASVSVAPACCCAGDGSTRAAAAN